MVALFAYITKTKTMSTILITGCNGLVGAEAVHFFAKKNWHVVGIDNNKRSCFLGATADTVGVQKELQATYSNFVPHNVDVRDFAGLERVFKEYAGGIDLIVHAAVQPSQDVAEREPLTDFSINANGTLNVLELYRQHCSDAAFIFTSTNKVYGNIPNRLPLSELPTRWDLCRGHRFYNGIDESMAIDQTQHSILGASKVAADILVQEYGRTFGLKTVVFRSGCLSGPGRAGSPPVGFLSSLMHCAMTKTPYDIFGYKGKQVRDNIHSYDLVNAFFHFFEQPRSGEVYNLGGSRFSNCSILEAIQHCEEITGNKVVINYVEEPRVGTHMWWIADVSKFRKHYPDWRLTRNFHDILDEIYKNAVAK